MLRQGQVFSVAQTASNLFVYIDLFAQEGGIQAYNRNLLEAYLTLDLPPAEILVLRDSDRDYNPLFSSSLQFDNYKTQAPMLGRVKLAVGLLKTLLRHRPQQVICGHINLVPLISLLCRRLNIPYTVMTYGKEVWSPLPSLKQQGLKQADSIWTISRYSRDHLCQANQINPHQVELLPCIVDGKAFTPGPKPPELLQKYGLIDAKVLMTVARLWSGDIYKGVDVTIRALPKIIQQFPAVKYLVIGRGDDRPRLQQLAKDLGVEQQVVFAGFVPTEELAKHYRVADAYVMPSQEGFGIVYLEAMACGVPVLAGDADGSADPLQDGRLGWQVPHRDPQAVASACIEMLRGQDRRCNGQWLREEALAQFSQEAFAQKLRGLLNGTKV